MEQKLKPLDYKVVPMDNKHTIEHLTTIIKWLIRFHEDKEPDMDVLSQYEEIKKEFEN